MTRYASIPVLALLAALAPAAAQAQGRVPITAAHIASAINGAGMQINADQVTLLADVAATEPSPVLLVESMQPLSGQRMKVRMSCADNAQCLPFFVLVRLNQRSAPEAVASVASARAEADPKSFVVRSGARATLLLDGAHVHIRIAVVCLENGAAGQTIRVASADHRQTYMARVVDQAVLRASL
jgi:hypothetical protein